VASWYADGPLGDCNNFWGNQHYDVIVRLHQGTAPDGEYTYAYDNGSTTITCSGGSCGEDLFLARGANSDTLSETVPLVYSVIFNGQTFSGSLIKVRMCYSNIEENAQCVIDAYVTMPSNTTPIDAKTGGDQCDANIGMARYSVHSMLASLNIVDTPISYVPQRGPAIAFTATYNQMEHQQPVLFDYSNLGPKWTFNWLAYVIDDPATQRPSTTVYVPGGGAETYRYDSGTQTFAPHPQSHTMLVRLTNPDRYERLFPDGSKQVFDRFQNAGSYPRKVFMTQWADSTGENVTIDYDPDPQYPLRIKKIRDALGFETNLEYNEANYPYRISKVREPSQFGLGRSASFAYTSGRLTKITDMIGIQSRMDYETGTDSINSLTTPYGITTFARGESATTRWVEITDPLLGKERVEFRDDAPIGATDLANTVPSGFTNAALNVANTFYWDKKAMQVAPGEYTKARITHWAKNADGGVSGIVASEKAPLENRVWFRYAGQSDTNHTGPSAKPIEVARILAPDGTTERSQYLYNTFGKMTKAIDPMGRVTSYKYDPANEIDLTAVFQRKPGGLSVDPENQSADKIYGCTYTTSHQPHMVTDAAGQTTTYLYTASKQLESVENAKHEITTYGYGDGSPGKPVGCLTSITSPLSGASSASMSFTYDSAHRVYTVTSIPDNYTVTTDHDRLDRKTMVTYPDGTHEEFQYTQVFGGTPKVILDLTASRDREGRWTFRHYNGNRQMDSITDPANRTTLYNWCACGSLDSITDPNEHVTTFHRDLQGRVYQKVFPDMSTIDLLFGGQETPNTVGTTSRLKSSTDALGRQTTYTYSKDGNIEHVIYPNPSGGPPTPSVHYVYDDYHNRLNSMDDGTGHTDYHYYPVTPGPSLGGGRLQDVDGPLQNDTIVYTYDELGRTQGQSVNGAAQTVERDPLGRVFHTENALGDFTSTYEGPTLRLQTVGYPNRTSVNYFYFENDHDRRLQNLQNLSERETAPLSVFEYEYQPEGEIVSWLRKLGGAGARRWYEYDDARQLLSVRDSLKPASATEINDYAYDPAGNRSSDNKYYPQGPLGNGILHSYNLNSLNQIQSFLTADGGIISQIVSLTHDLAGNLVNDGEGKTFEWDVVNRLTAINQTGSGQRTEFAYDGLGRRVKITEIGPGVTATIQPKSSDYASFSTAPFTLPAGSYTMTFEISSGDDVILIDSVALNNMLVANGDFETPDVYKTSGGYEYQPSGATWSFTSHSGIAFNGSDLTSQNPDAPDGKQVGFIYGQGKIFQTHTVSAGTYTLSFQAAQGGFNAANQSLLVTLRPSVAGVTTKRFVWCGTQICEERDSTGATVTKRFFAEGEQRIGGSDAGKYYYSRDHLGSIREVTNIDGSLLARYDYDPYGKAVVVDGNMSVDFGYTGHYFHAPSGLNLTLYRAYNPALGRWLSRDPIGEAGGVNLYGYVGNSPINSWDPLGLKDILLGNVWRGYTPAQLAAHNRENRNNRLTQASNRADNLENSVGIRNTLGRFYNLTPLNGDGAFTIGEDTIYVIDIHSYDQFLDTKCLKFDETILFVHGDSNPDHPDNLAFGTARIPRAALPSNCTAFGCNPVDRDRGGDEVMEDIITALQRARGK
jgi:RHS repeat-associated protein